MSTAADSKVPAPARIILVIDDDEHTRVLLRDLCEAAGFRVQLAVDADQGLEIIARAAPDLLLLDLTMPRKDGFSVLKTLRETPSCADLPVIILTATGDMDGKIRGMELGADDYVTKPFKFIELQTRINSALLVRDYRKRLVAADEELAQLRALDPVTGAGTYSQLKASLDGELARSRRYGRPLSALMIGFDDYQAMRYRLGREECDEYIARLASEVRGSLRAEDRLFRMEADEFVVLLPETSLAGAHTTADRLSSLIQSLPAIGSGGKVVIKARIGGAVFPSENIRTGEDLLREANRVYQGLRGRGSSRLVFDA